MSVVAMPPYPSTIPASAFSPTANDDNVWMATPAAAARRASASIGFGGVRPTLATHQAARTPITADMFKRVRWVGEDVRRRLLVRVDDKSDRT
jgi:hypothetical protein